MNIAGSSFQFSLLILLLAKFLSEFLLTFRQSPATTGDAQKFLFTFTIFLTFAIKLAKLHTYLSNARFS